jgi:hypothetical protein
MLKVMLHFSLVEMFLYLMVFLILDLNLLLMTIRPYLKMEMLAIMTWVFKAKIHSKAHLKTSNHLHVRLFHNVISLSEGLIFTPMPMLKKLNIRANFTNK